MKNNYLLRLAAMLFLLPFFHSVFAQRPAIDDFTMYGDTYRTEDECFRLTDAEDYSSGSIWYKLSADLSGPFSVDLTVFLGCQDEDGADGMVFVFNSRANRVGGRGEGIGFAGLAPSLGIEIDTWRNYHLNDPAEDHITFLVNGQIAHYDDLAGPVRIPNIEDCRRHRLSIRWKPENQRLSVEIDGQEVIAAQQDLVNTIFRGNPIVYWGVTAATGRYNNIHEVCFDRLSLRLPLKVETVPTAFGQ